MLDYMWQTGYALASIDLGNNISLLSVWLGPTVIGIFLYWLRSKEFNTAVKNTNNHMVVRNMHNTPKKFK